MTYLVKVVLEWICFFFFFFFPFFFFFLFNFIALSLCSYQMHILCVTSWTIGFLSHLFMAKIISCLCRNIPASFPTVWVSSLISDALIVKKDLSRLLGKYIHRCYTLEEIQGLKVCIDITPARKSQLSEIWFCSLFFLSSWDTSFSKAVCKLFIHSVLLLFCFIFHFSPGCTNW